MSGKPTYHPMQAVARFVQMPSRQLSKRDVDSSGAVKVRQPGQGAPEDVARADLAASILAVERQARETTTGGAAAAAAPMLPMKRASEGAAASSASAPAHPWDDSDDPAEAADAPAPAAAAAPAAEGSGPVAGDAADNDEDDTAELAAELERIRKEREEAKKRKEREAKVIDEASRGEAALRSNPLLEQARAHDVRPRWTDDTVFRNQSRDAPQEKKRFINDPVRSDFHRRFLARHIK